MKKIFFLVLAIFGAMIVKAQNVGINTAAPQAMLHVKDSNVLFSGPNNVLANTPYNPPIEGPGARVMWYPQKAAFRAGLAFGNQWDKDSIGILSIALGNSTKAKGESSFATGAGTNASGIRSTATGDFTSASGYGSFSTGTQTLASGDYSFAGGTSGASTGFSSFSFGQASSATSNTAIAMGINAKAPGFSSIALGQDVRAPGPNSIALGRSTLSVGNVGLAAGFNTKATADYSTVLGSFNDTTETAIAFNPGPSDRIFQVGNGTANNARNNAVTILRNGNTGIGTVAPTALFQVSEGSALFSNNGFMPGSPANPPISGSGRRMMWYADKAAFRAGYADGTQWDNVNTGDHSFAAGRSSVASASNTVALGFLNTASGLYSVSLGNSSVASGSGAIAIGSSVTASGFSATSMGYESASRALASFSMGFNTIAKSDFSFVAGKFNDTTNTNRIFEIGNGTSNNARSNAVTVLNNGNVGIGTTAPQKQLDVVGGPSAIPVALVIGNKGGFGPAALELVSDYGLSSQWRPGYIRSNDIGGFTGSLEFYTNGTGSTNLYGNVKGFEVRNGAALTASGAVGSYSDARLKNSITAFTDGLKVINQLNPVQFYYNADAPFKTDQQQTGIIAQELEKAAPYMVEKNKQNGYDDLRSVNNQAYTFLLINAVKELAKQNADLIKRIEELERKLAH